MYVNNKRSSFRAFLVRLSKLRNQKSNSEKIETYLRRCARDPVISRSSLFHDFLSKQRPEDRASQRWSPPSLGASEQDIQDIEMEDNPSTQSIISASIDSHPLTSDERSTHTGQSSPEEVMHASPERSISKDTLPPLDNYNLLKVLGQGCMGKVRQSDAWGCRRPCLILLFFFSCLLIGTPCETRAAFGSTVGLESYSQGNRRESPGDRTY